MHSELLNYSGVNLSEGVDSTTLGSIEFNVNWLPLESFALEVQKAGFDLYSEIRRKARLEEQFGREKGKAIWIKGVTDQALEHAFEYSRKDIVRMAPPYELVSGELFSPRFEAWGADLVGKEERGGSVFRGFKKVEEALQDIPDFSFVVWVSPDGPLGIGKLEYDYSWTHIFWKEEKKVRYVSVRTDFSLSEHRKFLNSFSSEERFRSDRSYSSEMEEIQEILENPLTIESGWELPDLGRAMAGVRGGIVAPCYFDVQTGRERYFSELVSALVDIEIDNQRERTDVAGLISYFERQLENATSSEELLRLIGNYVLTLNYLLKQDQALISLDTEVPAYIMNEALSSDHLTQLQEVGGCAGGERQNTRTFTSYKTKEQTFTGFCPVCHTFVTDLSVGETCPGCHTEYVCAE